MEDCGGGYGGGWGREDGEGGGGGRLFMVGVLVDGFVSGLDGNPKSPDKATLLGIGSTILPTLLLLFPLNVLTLLPPLPIVIIHHTHYPFTRQTAQYIREYYVQSDHLVPTRIE